MLTDRKLCHVTENALYCVFTEICTQTRDYFKLLERLLDERLLETPPKEVLYFDVGIAKKMA